MSPSREEKLKFPRVEAERSFLGIVKKRFDCLGYEIRGSHICFRAWNYKTEERPRRSLKGRMTTITRCDRIILT